MKFYKLIEEGNIPSIEASISKGDDYSGLTVLTVLDKLNSASLLRLRSNRAITDYDELFDPERLKDRQTTILLHQGIKILISAWGSNTLANTGLKQRLDYEASRRLAQFWMVNRNESYQSLSTITEYINQWVKLKSEKWLYNTLPSKENSRLNLHINRKLNEIINNDTNSSIHGLLKATYKLKFFHQAVKFYKKSKFESNFCEALESELHERFLRFPTDFIREKINILSFTGLIKDWKSNLVSIVISEEIEDALISILEKINLPICSHRQITDLTITGMIDDFKNNQLDHHLTNYLRGLFKETIQINLFNELLTDQSMDTISSITSEIILKFKNREIDLIMPYPIEKVLLPDLYQLKKKCKKILSSTGSLEHKINSSLVSRNEIDAIKSVISHIPELVEKLLKDKLPQSSAQTAVYSEIEKDEKKQDTHEDREQNQSSKFY